MSEQDVQRSGFVAVAGRPNAGKSTLINKLVGEHVAIVSPIAQTTRRVVRAALTTGETQLVFVDLPGSQRPIDRLTERMQRSVVNALPDVDVVLWVVDARQEPRAGERAVAEMVFAAERPVVIALNKVDLVKKAQLLERIVQLDAIVAGREYAALVPISALTGDGTERLVEEIAKLVPEGPAYYPEGDVTDMRVSERVAEYVREAALRFLKEEMPHATIVEVAEIEETDDGSIDIECIIWVERDSQVGIVVGAGGATVKQIGIHARQVIEDMLGRHCFLQLRVKVKRNWRGDDAQLARWGL